LLLLLFCSLTKFLNQSPLHYAVLHGAHDAVQTLAELPGVLVDAQNREGATALWLAAQRGDERSAALLLQHGARPNLPNSEGATPLHAAAARGDAALLRLLLQHGAHLARPDLAGDTPLHWAVREERAAAAALLAASGASLAARNEDGETPAELARACNLPHMEAAIAAGAKKALSAP
jgi:ankyrin repeat protein